MMTTIQTNKLKSTFLSMAFILAMLPGVNAQQAVPKTTVSPKVSNQPERPVQPARLQKILAQFAAKRKGTVPVQQNQSPLATANKPVLTPIPAAQKNISQTYYKFTRNRSWFIASNWENQHLPPQVA